MRIIGKLLAVIVLMGILAVIGLAGNNWIGEVKAAPTQGVTITDPPTYCQEGTWVIDDWTYIGKRCVNWAIATPTPTPTSKAELSWKEVAKPSCWKFDKTGWREISCPEPTPTPTPTPKRYGQFYFGNVCPIPIQTFQDEQCTTNLYVYDYFGYKIFLTQGNCGVSMDVEKP